MHIYNLKVVLKLKAMQITQNYGKKNIYFFNCRILQDLQDSPWHACIKPSITKSIILCNKNAMPLIHVLPRGWWLTIFTPCNLCLFIFYELIDMLILYLLHSILLILYSVHVQVCINVRKTLKIYKITCRNSKLWHVFFSHWFFILRLILLTKCINQIFLYILNYVYNIVISAVSIIN